MKTKASTKIIKLFLASIVTLGVIFVPLKDNAPHLLTSGVSAVYATGAVAPPPAVATNQDLANTLEIILKIVYLFLWPFLAIAGLCLDNGLVYGSYFQLDAALFTFRNIIKNFANFILGFLFLWSILKYIFNFGDKAKNPMSMITTLLIAGIGIQASWFLMGGLIDISTVATVGIGGLPLQLLKQDSAGKKPLFGLKTSLKLSDVGDALTADKGFVILYTYPTTPDQYYLPCDIDHNKLIGGDKRAIAFGVPKLTDDTVDHSSKIGNSDVSWSQINQEYCIFGNNILKLSLVGTNDVLAGSDQVKTWLTQSQDAFRAGNACGGANANLCQTVSNIAQKGKGYQGAFYSLYGSLLNLGGININVTKSDGSMTMEAIIKVIIGLSYLIPLLILCVVLIMRIAILRITIAFSPLLVLSKAFDRDVSKLGKSAGDGIGKFTVANVISTIFLPVIATFAISITIVFLSVLSEGITKGNSLEKIGMRTYNQGNKSCISLIITDLCIDTPSQDTGASGMLDFFPWVILNIFGIGLMRTILMTVLKANAFTGKIAGTIGDLAKQAVNTARIIPLPNGGAVGLGALKQARTNITNDMSSGQGNDARMLTNAFEHLGSGSKSKTEKQITQYMSATTSDGQTSAMRAAFTSQAGAFAADSANPIHLKQYGDKGNQFAEKLWANEMGGKTFPGIDAAFQNPEFIKKIMDKYGRDKEDIKRMYSGDEGKGDAAIMKTWQAIDNLSQTSLSADGKTYTASNGTKYTIDKDGFKDSTGKLLNKKDERETVKISNDDLKKMNDATTAAGVKLSSEFNTWIETKIKPAVPATPPVPANNPPAGSHPQNPTTTPPPAGGTTPPAPATPPPPTNP